LNQKNPPTHKGTLCDLRGTENELRIDAWVPSKDKLENTSAIMVRFTVVNGHKEFWIGYCFMPASFVFKTYPDEEQLIGEAAVPEPVSQQD
jgi:hypothetical protein